ncbi:MAG TPA: PAAR domain-containing protein [Xanthobacteraceae bacterium]|nr:PAAR domain-containing protein [Xanthobacteraceae bacterium]
MRLALVALVSLLSVGANAGLAAAQQPRLDAGQPGVVIQGSQDAMIGGKPAARVGDGTSSSAPIVEGSANVFINGKPAAIVGGRSGCGGVTVSGAANVFINGKRAAQSGSLTTACTK